MGVVVFKVLANNKKKALTVEGVGDMHYFEELKAPYILTCYTDTDSLALVGNLNTDYLVLLVWSHRGDLKLLDFAHFAKTSEISL